MRKMLGNALVPLALFLLASCASAPPSRTSGAAQAIGQTQQSDGKGRAMALVQGGVDAGQPVPAAPQPQSATASSAAPASVDMPPPQPGQLTPEEDAYLQNYLARLNYLVYYNENAKIDPAVAKAAVTQANRYLIEKLGLSVIDFDQIEKNKKDYQDVYRSETGGQIGIVQYIAQKHNADVYLEIDFTVANETRDGKYYATAQGSMKIYDTSTAGLLGSVALVGKQAFHPSSAALAATNAVAGTVWDAMPKITEQSKSLLKGSLSRGVRYEVIIQNTPDSKAISQIRRALAKKLREVEQVSYSPEETKLYLYTFQKGDKVEDAMYDAASAANMNDLYLVFSRGKSFTFNSGM
jgi:hypothetical protein